MNGLWELRHWQLRRQSWNTQSFGLPDVRPNDVAGLSGASLANRQFTWEAKNDGASRFSHPGLVPGALHFVVTRQQGANSNAGWFNVDFSLWTSRWHLMAKMHLTVPFGHHSFSPASGQWRQLPHATRSPDTFALAGWHTDRGRYTHPETLEI